MNPNKHKPTRWKDLELCKNCGDKEFGPDVVDRKTGLCAECLVGALERENKELRVTLGAERKDYEQVKAKLSQANGTIAELDQLTDEFKARAEKAEKKNAELKEMLKRYLEGEETEEDDGFVAVLK